MNARDPADLDNLLEPPQAEGFNRPLILWLIVIGLVVLFLPLYLLASTVGNDVATLESQLEEIQLALAEQPTPEPQVQALQATVDQVNQQVSALESVRTTLGGTNVDWPAVMALLGDYDAAQMEITALEQTENRLLLNGRAVDDTAVLAYARRLEASELFARVIVQSITLLPTPPMTPTPSPGATPAGTADSTPSSGDSGTTPQASITPTPDLRDEYEPDDAQPRPIFLDQLQAHNFYPVFDVDNATFLAKAGRFYRISTLNLAPGVDTFLTITMGDTSVTNDDAKPGTLDSEISFQAGDSDVEVLVQVQNRGQYGGEMTYQLWVQEIVPTVAPTATPEPTAVPTDTPLPTGTPMPTSTAPIIPTDTPTPDLRDEYEPDGTQPHPIAIGETQLHNFYPQGDVDKVSVLVKQDRHYQASTANLALGVDTSMVVGLGNEEWRNDDYDMPGSGNFASAVCFPAAVDGTAVITVTNKAQQFAADKTYDLRVAEVPQLEASTQQLDFGPVTAGGTDPPPQEITLTSSDDVAWTAETQSPWISLNPAGATTPSQLSVSADSSGMVAGTYQDNIFLSWASLCRHTVTVTLQIQPASSRLFYDIAKDETAKPLPARPFKRPPLQQNETVEFVILVELKTGLP